MCPCSGGTRSRLSDIDSGKLVFMSGSPRPTSSSLRDPLLQALTLLGGAMFSAWRLRRPFLGECRWVPRYFWRCWACLGYGPALGPTLKRPCATLVRSVRRTTNTESSLVVAGLGHTSVGCVARFMDQVGCILVSVAVGGRGPRHFWDRRACLGYSLVPEPTLKKAVLALYVGRATNTVVQSPVAQ